MRWQGGTLLVVAGLVGFRVVGYCCCCCCCAAVVGCCCGGMGCARQPCWRCTRPGCPCVAPRPVQGVYIANQVDEAAMGPHTSRFRCAAGPGRPGRAPGTCSGRTYWQDPTDTDPTWAPHGPARALLPRLRPNMLLLLLLLLPFRRCSCCCSSSPPPSADCLSLPPAASGVGSCCHHAAAQPGCTLPLPPPPCPAGLPSSCRPGFPSTVAPPGRRWPPPRPSAMASATRAPRAPPASRRSAPSTSTAPAPGSPPRVGGWLTAPRLLLRCLLLPAAVRAAPVSTVPSSSHSTIPSAWLAAGPVCARALLPDCCTPEGTGSHLLQEWPGQVERSDCVSGSQDPLPCCRTEP